MKNKFNALNFKSAFTLIELLVVIAIIGILSGLIVISMNASINSANDAKRKAGIDTIRKALVIYGTLNGMTYPVESSCTIGGGTTPCTILAQKLFEFLPNLPRDPVANGFYTYSSTGTSYNVSALLSNSNFYSYSPSTGFTNTAAQIFTTVGTTSWVAPANCNSVEVLVVAGGGGGGRHSGGGGGGGGLIYYGSESPRVASSYPITPGNSYTVTVGNGGTSLYGVYPAQGGGIGLNGGNSVFGSLTAIGGGGGGYHSAKGSVGGSAGGSSRNLGVGLSGTAGQGNAGGASNIPNGSSPDTYPAAGGGGAGAIGGSPTTTVGGVGGAGLPYSISGTSTYYAGGGGGNIQYGSYSGGAGGIGGGGAGAPGDGISSSYGYDGVANTGGGGGGTHYNAPASPTTGRAGNGGSGIVIVRCR